MRRPARSSSRRWAIIASRRVASVNQANPNLISIAGQFNRDSNYYNQDLNYTWVAHGSKGRARVEPMDRHAPKGSGFIQLYQARAGWWSPDGKWFAFESNRACDNMDGNTYAIFIQDSSGKDPAMQVTNCHWNAQHPKWFPPGSNGGKTMLIARSRSRHRQETGRFASRALSERLRNGEVGDRSAVAIRLPAEAEFRFTWMQRHGHGHRSERC